MDKIATFFGANRTKKSSKEYKDSIEIGRILASKGYTVRNGGYGGLMEAVSKGVREYSGNVEGITCLSFGFSEGNKYLTKVQVASDIYNRLRLLIQDSSVFIVQVGGVGTLSELMLVLDIARKMDNPPQVILIGHYWNWFYDCPLISEHVKNIAHSVIDIQELNLLLI